MFLIFSAEVVIRLQQRFRWQDVRLNISNCTGILDDLTINNIWKPSPYVHSTSFIKNVERIDGSTNYFEAEPPYNFYWYMELDIGLQCPFDFAFYPFDSHTCNVSFRSFYHTYDVVWYSSDPLRGACIYDVCIMREKGKGVPKNKAKQTKSADFCW